MADVAVYARAKSAVHDCPSAAGGGRGGGAADDLVDARARHRLQQAFHGSRHQHHDQEAGETEAGSLLVHGPARLLHLDLYRAVVRRRQSRPVPRQPLQSVRVADRGPRERAELHERLQRLQQPVVFAGRAAATGLRHLAAVSQQQAHLHSK